MALGIWAVVHGGTTRADHRRDKLLAQRAGVSYPPVEPSLMSPPSPEVAPFTLTEAEVTAYLDLVTDRQQKSVPPPRGWVSAACVPLALGCLLMIFSALRGAAGQADLGRLLFVGTVAYLGGYFALRYELSRHQTPWRVAISRADPLYHAPKQVIPRENCLEYTCEGIVAQYLYRAFTDVEVTPHLVLGWLGHGKAVPIPIRAFASRPQAEAFTADLRRLIDAARADAVNSSHDGP